MPDGICFVRQRAANYGRRRDGAMLRGDGNRRATGRQHGEDGKMYGVLLVNKTILLQKDGAEKKCRQAVQ
jgi:hypothetical protein